MPNKKTCYFCQTNWYEGKYAEHLKSKHPKIIKGREIIRNTTRFMGEKELEEVIVFLNEVKKDNGNKQ